MDSSKIIILIATWVLMLLWLAFVVVSGVLAFALFMIPKTFAYMFAFFHLITGVLRSTAEVPVDLRSLQGAPPRYVSK